MADISTTGLVGALVRRALVAAVPVDAVRGAAVDAAAVVDVGVDVVAADVGVDSEIMCSIIIVGFHPNIYFLLRLCNDYGDSIHSTSRKRKHIQHLNILGNVSFPCMLTNR